MKKYWISLLVLGVMLLSACSAGSQDNSVETGNTTQAGSTTQSGTDETALPETTRLMVGTMLLEGDTAVDTAQAQALLPLWKVYSSLMTSETSAEAEIEGLFKQIQEEMTPEQLAAIAAMDLTQTNMPQLLADSGLAMGPGAGMFDQSNPEVQATFEAMRQSGEVPQGGFPGGQRPDDAGTFQGGPPIGGEGGPMAGGVNPQDMDPEQLATLQAQRGARGGQRGSDTFMLRALIAFLEGKAGE